MGSGLLGLSCARPPEASLPGGFLSDAAWFYERGFWLPPTMLLDAWLVMTGNYRLALDCIHREEGRGGPVEGREAYHRWLELFDRLRKEREISSRSYFASRPGTRYRLFPALVLVRALPDAVLPDGVSRPPGEAAGFAGWADALLGRRPGPGRERVLRPYSAFGAGGLALRLLENEGFRQGLGADVARVVGAEKGIPAADRTALSLLRDGHPEVTTRPLPPIADEHGDQARRYTRSESGVFLERGGGRLPSRLAQLSPIEFIYREAAPELFLYRIASNDVQRSFGRTEVTDRRRPRVRLSLRIVERAEWHRRRRGRPLGDVSLVRATAAVVAERFLLALAGTDWDAVVHLVWESALVSRRGDRLGWQGALALPSARLVRFRGRHQEVRNLVLDRFPVLIAGAHRLSRCSDAGSGGVPDLDLRVSFGGVADPGRRSPGDRGAVVGFEIQPAGAEEVAWTLAPCGGEGGRSEGGRCRFSLAGDVVVRYGLPGREPIPAEGEPEHPDLEVMSD